MDLAVRLSKDPTEAARRSAVSRAYYSAFCEARDRLLLLGVPLPSTGEAHKKVWNAFSAAGDTKIRRIALDGNKLRKRRTKADYDLRYPSLASDLPDSLTLAAEIRTAVDSVKHSSQLW